MEYLFLFALIVCLVETYMRSFFSFFLKYSIVVPFTWLNLEIEMKDRGTETLGGSESIDKFRIYVYPLAQLKFTIGFGSVDDPSFKTGNLKKFYPNTTLLKF